MSVYRVTKTIRLTSPLLLTPVLLTVWECGQPAAASGEPATVPAMAEGEAMPHLAVTPLPQDTFYPWLATSGGHLVQALRIFRKAKGQGKLA